MIIKLFTYSNELAKKNRDPVEILKFFLLLIIISVYLGLYISKLLWICCKVKWRTESIVWICQTKVLKEYLLIIITLITIKNFNGSNHAYRS